MKSKPLLTILSLSLFAACAVKKPAQAVYGSFTDERDGQVYKTVKIGKHTWMAQNLNYKTDGAQYYGGDEANAKIYGMLYGFYAAQAAVPKGWHLPTAAEWEELGQACPDLVNTLKITFGGEYGAGKFRYLEGMATFYTSTHDGTPLITMHIDKGDNTLRTNRQGTAWQLSVRCVKDQPAE